MVAPELGRIAQHRARLNDPDVLRRKDPQQVEDDNAKLAEWERKVRDGLVVLSLKDNDGIAMLLSHVEEELATIDEGLRNAKPTDFSPDGLAKYAYTQKALFDRRDLWEWFRSFFTDAKRAVREVREDLDLQEHEDTIAPGY